MQNTSVHHTHTCTPHAIQCAHYSGSCWHWRGFMLSGPFCFSAFMPLLAINQALQEPRLVFVWVSHIWRASTAKHIFAFNLFKPQLVFTPSPARWGDSTTSEKCRIDQISSINAVTGPNLASDGYPYSYHWSLCCGLRDECAAVLYKASLLSCWLYSETYVFG